MSKPRSERFQTILLGCLIAVLASACSQKPSGPESVTQGSDRLPVGTVKQIDEVELRKLMQAKGKPLLVNFWATWCGPCREEFPDLVRLDQEFLGKIDFITVSLDDPKDITTEVRGFLTSVNAGMPAYLLKTADEGGVITSVSKEWHGALPFTILYDANGTAVYEREGKVKLDVIKAEIEMRL